MPTPILIGHDPQRIIGSIEPKGDRLLVRMTMPLTREQFWSLFPGAGIQILQTSGDLIEAAEILEVSLEPTRE